MYDWVKPACDIHRKVTSLKLKAPVDHRCNAPVHFGSIACEVGIEATKSMEGLESK
jgi:hypothetical protein